LANAAIAASRVGSNRASAIGRGAAKATLASVLAKAAPGLRLNEHLEHDGGETVFRHACKLGLEGIVSKRKGSPYRSGRSPDWLKMKNPVCAAVTREAEEDWTK
jgi:ATP-dependent DNA ligase